MLRRSLLPTCLFALCLALTIGVRAQDPPSFGHAPLTESVFITFDRSEYLPGDITQIRATGFLPSEPVTFTLVVKDPQTGAAGEPATLAAEADADGVATASWQVCDECLGYLIHAHAKGETSGREGRGQASDGLIPNGNFETGTLINWATSIAGTGNWYNYTGTLTPFSNHVTSAPPEGTRAAVTDQGGPGSQILYQDLLLLPSTGHVLTMTLWYNNWANVFTTPANLTTSQSNQQYRVDLIKTSAAINSVAAADVLLNIFQTKVGDAPSRTPFNLTTDISALAGQTVRLRFATVETISYLNSGVDNIQLTSGTQNTTLSVTPASGGYGGAATLSATLKTSGGTPVANRTVSFGLNGTSKGQAVTNAAGVASISNAALTTGTGFINAGVYATGATASFAGVSGQFASSNGNAQLTVQQASQILNFGSISDHYVGDPSFAVSADSNSGLPVTLSLVSGPATLNGNMVTVTGPGTVWIRATQPGNSNYLSATADASFLVYPPLNVTSITMETRPWYGPAPADSNEAVSIYNSLAVGVAGYAPGPKTLTIFDNVNNQITFGGSNSSIGYHHHFAFDAPVTGTLMIRVAADFGGGGTLLIDGQVVEFRSNDMYWGGNYGDPTQYLKGTVQISAGPHVIDSYGFEQCCDGPQQAQYSYLGSPFTTFAAPANAVPTVVVSGAVSAAPGDSPIYSFTVADSDAGATFAVASASCGANGTAAGPLSVTPTGGSFACTFNTPATQSVVSIQVKDNLGALSNIASQTVAVNKRAQTISFAPLGARTYGDPDFTLNATASSGLLVNFTGAGSCLVTGELVHMTAAGNCSITASQAGNGTYDAAPNVTQAFSIAKADATIVVSGYSNVYDGTAHGATGTAAGINGEDLGSLLNLGTSFSDAPGGTTAWSFAGNTNYKATTGTAAIVITKADASIAVTGYTGVYDAQAHGATGSASGVGGADLSTLLNLGTSFSDAPGGTATWSFAGNTNYNAASGTAAIVITKADASIAVNGYTGVYDAQAHGATGSASGVGGVGLSTLLNLGASFSNVPGGTATWSFAGNTNYNATSGTAAIVISKADASIAVTGYTGVYDALAHGASGSASGVGGVDLSTLLNLGASFTDAPGGTATWSFAGNTNYNAATNTAAIVISKANASIAVNGYTGVYDAQAHGASGNASGIGGVDLSSLLNLGASFTDAPGGTAAWSFAGNTNYNAASGTAAIVISKADAAIAVNGYTGVYDAQAHGATGSASGVGGVDLSTLLNLGASFTDAPGGTATWSFTGNTNYNAASGTAAIVISKADAAIAVNGYTGVYDAHAHRATGSASGVGGVDLSTLLNIGASFTNVPGGTATWSFAGNTNYNATSGTAAIVISKADASIAVTGYTGVYDAQAHGASGSASGVGGVDLSTLLNLGASFTNVPGGSATWSFAGNTNYNAATNTAAIVISKADASIAVTGYTGVYDAQAHGATGSASGFGAVDLSTLLNLGSSFTNVPGGTATWSFAGNTNYNAATNTAAIVISKADASIAVTGYTGVYDAQAHGASGSASGVDGVDLSTLLNLGASFTDAPGGTATWSFAGDTNYNAASATAAIVITKADASIAVTGYTGVYDAQAHGASGSASGVGGVDLSTLLNLGASFTDAPGGTATWSFAGDTNYNAASATAAIVITKADASIAVTGYTGVYDAQAHGASGSASGVGGVDLSTLLNLGSSFTNVPGATATWSFAGDTNYNATSGTAAIVISKADAAIAVNGYTGAYDAQAHGATGSASGVGGVDLSTLLNLGSSFTNVPGGPATWSFTGDTNYNATSGAAAIVISKAASTTQIICSPATLIYSGVAQDVCAASVTGVGGLDTSVAVGYTNNVNAGTASASASYGGDANHESSTDTGTFAIGQKLASVTPTATGKSYGSMDPVLTGTLVGFVPTDNVSGTYARNAGDTAGIYTINATLNPAGALSNYAIAYNTASFVISKAVLAVQADNKAKLLGGLDPALTYQVTGLQLGDTVAAALSGALARDGGEAVGSYPIRQGTLAANGNYTIAFTGGALTIGYNTCLLYDPTKPIKSGATIPVKLTLCSSSGVNVSSSNIVVAAVSLQLISASTSSTLNDSGSSNAGGNFRFDPTLGPGYIFNLKTTGLSRGTYRLEIRVTADPTPSYITFEIRQ